MNSKMGYSLALVYFLLTLPTANGAEICAKIDQISGTTCPELKVMFDVSGCKLEPAIREAKVDCGKNGQASARLWTPEYIYMARLNLDPKSTAKSPFTLAGPISAAVRNLKSAPTAAKASTKAASKKTGVSNLPAPTKKETSAKTDVILSPMPAVKTDTPQPTAKAEPLSLPIPAVEIKKDEVPAVPPTAAEIAKTMAPPPVSLAPISTSTEGSAKSEAASAPAAASVPTTKASTSISGYLDMYYSYNLNKPSVASTTAAGTGTSLPSPTNALRAYDLFHDQISLGLAEITVKHTNGGATILMDFDFGSSADANAFGAETSTTNLVSKNIGQALLTYAFSDLPGLVIGAGKMYTHIGLETAKAKDNWNYSRSLIYTQTLPVWHTGASVGFETMQKTIFANAYIYNSSNIYNESNKDKSYGAQIKWAPSSSTSVVYNFLVGPSNKKAGSHSRQLHNVNFTWGMSTALQFNGDFLLGSEDTVTISTNSPKLVNYTGASLGAKFAVTPSYFISGRADYLADTDSAIYPTEFSTSNQVITSYTLTNNIALNENFNSIFEVRLDQSSRETKFVTKDGTSSSQTTVLVSGLYAF
jgi:hypothetical protein